MTNQTQVGDDVSQQHEAGQPRKRGAQEQARYLVSLPYAWGQWLLLPALGIDARERVAMLAPAAEGALILRAEELRAVLEYVDTGEADVGSTTVCGVEILVRLSASEIFTTDGWAFSPVDERFTFQPGKEAR